MLLKKEQFRLQRRPEPPEFHAGTGKHGLQASLSSPQAPQALQNMGCRHACAGCRHPCRRRRHRRHGKTGVAGILFLHAGIADRACAGCRHLYLRRRHRKRFKSWVPGMSARVAGIPVVVAGTAGKGKHGLQASSSSPQPSQARQNVDCRHLCLRRRHRKRFKSWVAGMLAWVAGMHVWVAGIANTANHGCRHACPFGVLKF